MIRILLLLLLMSCTVEPKTEVIKPKFKVGDCVLKSDTTKGNEFESPETYTLVYKIIAVGKENYKFKDPKLESYTRVYPFFLLDEDYILVKNEICEALKIKVELEIKQLLSPKMKW